MVNTTESLTGTDFKVLQLYQNIQAQNYNFHAAGGVINGPENGYIFYVDSNVRTTTIKFYGISGEENTLLTPLTFNCPVIFSTKPRVGSGDGNRKNITITGNVVFNKGIKFETNGSFRTISSDLSIINLGNGEDPFTMTCKYTDATFISNLVPFNINGYGRVNFNNNSIINAYMQPYADRCIEQLSNPTKYNIYQYPGNKLNVYIDSQMIGTNLIDMRQQIVYPDEAPIIYDLYILSNVEVEILSLPSIYQLYIQSDNVRLTNIEFESTSNINISSGSKLSLISNRFYGTSPLINLTGPGILEFKDNNILTPLDTSGVIINNNNGASIITSNLSYVNLPTTYTFQEPVNNYQGFTFNIDTDSTYNFGTFDAKTLYINSTNNSESTITINANYGVYLDISGTSSVILNNCNIYSALNYNNNYAVYKENTGSFTFSENSKLFIGFGTRFLRDVSLDNEYEYINIGEDNCKFYIFDNSGNFTNYVFDIDNYNSNTLYYLASQGIFLGTNNGEYDITSNFSIKKNNLGTLELGELGESGGLGLRLLNDVSGANFCTNCTIKGKISNTSASRLHVDTSGCIITMKNIDFYDSDSILSPLLIGDNANIVFDNNVTFNMNSTETTYLYNANDSKITNLSNAIIIIGAFNKQYNFDSGISNNTTEPPYIYNNKGWYEIPIKTVELENPNTDRYDISGINAHGLILYTTNSPTIKLYTLNPITINNVASTTLTIYSTSVLSNLNNHVAPPLILKTNDISMNIYVNNNTFNVYGYGSISKLGTGEVNNDILDGNTVTLNYYTNNYDLDVTNIVPTLEYNNTIYIFDGNYSFINASDRLTFQTQGNGNNPTFINTTNIQKGLTINHSTNNTVTFDGINYIMNDNDSELIINGTGIVNCSGCTIESTSNVIDNVIKLNGSNQFTINNGTNKNDGSGNFIVVGNNGILNLINTTIENNNGSCIYSTSSDDNNTNLNFDTVIFNNNTNTSIVRHINNTNMNINNCNFNQNVSRTGPIIELGNNSNTITGSCDVSGSSDISGNYYYFIKAYTSGNINTNDTQMNATRTNIYWVNLDEAYNNGANKTPYSSNIGYNYAAYSYDPTETINFVHSGTGTGISLNNLSLSEYNVYIAVGNVNTQSYTANLSCTQFTDLCGNIKTLNVPDIILPERIAEKFIGSIGPVNQEDTRTFDVSANDRVLPIQIVFANSSGIYIGDINLNIQFNTQLSNFKYNIIETVAPPEISISENTLNVSDIVSTELTIPFELSKGYFLPIYILPVASNIITFFEFKNTAQSQSYVDYNTYIGYPDSTNKNLLQKISAGTRTGTFYIRYMGSGIYYEPPAFSFAKLDVNLYSDNLNETIIYSTVNRSSINIKNLTTNLKFPLSYISSPDLSNNVILYDLNNGTQTAELITPSNDYSGFIIKYNLTLKFKMPLITYDGSNHQISITGIDYYENENITYEYSDPSGCTIDSVGNNNCILTYSGTDLTEKTIDVTVYVANLTSTHNGTIYFKKPNHQIQFQLTNLNTLKGFDENNNIIEVTSTTQTANSYYSFPNTLLVSVNDNLYIDRDPSPTINISKGDTKTLSIITAGIVTNDTPDISNNKLSVDITLTTSKITQIMPTLTDPSNNSIDVLSGNYQGSIDIQFTDNHLISGNGSTYTVTFDESKYSTVNSIIFSDTSKPHIIIHKFGIQPNTRHLHNKTYTSTTNDQVPDNFTFDANLQIVNPSSYNIGFPVGVYTNFIPYNTITGNPSQFRVNYTLNGTDDSDSVVSLVENVNYKVYQSDMTTSTNNYVDISSNNYDEPQYIYFVLLSNIYKFVDIYAHYTNTSGTDMSGVVANGVVSNLVATKILLTRYDFTNAFRNPTNTLQVNLGAWIIKPNSNGDLVFVYNGTLNQDNSEGVGSTFVLQAPTDLVHKIINTSYEL